MATRTALAQVDTDSDGINDDIDIDDDNDNDNDNDGILDAAECTVAAPSPFGIELTHSTAGAITFPGIQPIVGDLDGDGISEIVVPSAFGEGLIILEGDGSDFADTSIDINIDVSPGAVQPIR